MKARDPEKVPRKPGARVSVSTFVVFCFLLVVPAYALSELATRLDWRAVIGLPLAASVFAFFAYRSDKRRAVAGEWRVSEGTLHFAELIGGWPGAFLAQRIFRHKTSKITFQVAFWLIVLTHHFIAADFLNEWKLS